ncbi:hypothetical protein M9H77_36456 [Catharanthus roseus]|uniref:Uncharacterized protein n=1 Tax=Catharanthus roseus TaxID=4058 RepID=A0ACB9ZRU4_CATRO|nr:hypothetical protein M9H77_36456 [Catharanthus roseus]
MNMTFVVVYLKSKAESLISQSLLLLHHFPSLHIKEISHMDREQEEMQFLGLFGIYSEAYKVIIKWRKIFSQITLSLILPLSFIFLSHMEISHYLDFKIRHNESKLHRTQSSTTDEKRKKLSDLISSESATLWIFNIFYFGFLLIFSLLSTSAVVYTIASIYTGRDITFKKVMTIVPKVWKRLLVTFLCAFFAFFVYNFFAGILLIGWAMNLADSYLADIIVLTIMVIIYVTGSVYMTIIWQLATVISVLEDSYGIKAMMKSKELIKGKMMIALVIFFKLNLSLVAVQIFFDEFVIHGWRIGILHRIGFGLLCLLLLFKLILFGLVIQTIIYFVCKSYHHENIDKSLLSDHLEVYSGDYVPLKSKDIQLEQYDYEV